jgi:hypothetical protein
MKLTALLFPKCCARLCGRCFKTLSQAATALELILNTIWRI